MNRIISLSEIDETKKPKILEAIVEIFFLSTSVKTFASEEKKQSFFKKWCGDYISHYPSEFLILMTEDKVMGYLSGCFDSLEASLVLSVPGFKVFEDLFHEFPAHLHINFHPDARGLGLGSLLIKEFIKRAQISNLAGVHLITSPDALNVSFYTRLGFSYTVTRTHNDMPLYFMGHSL